MTRLPVEQQNKTVEQSRDTQLKPIPINTDRLPNPPVPQPVAPRNIPISLPDETDRYEPTMSKVFYDPVPTATPTPVPQKQNNSNKGAFIIGGGIVLAALLFKMLPSQQNSPQAQQPTPIDQNITPANISPSTSSQQSAPPPTYSPPVTPPSPVAVNRPSTDGFINEYYSKIKSGQTSSAWNDISSDYQNNSQDNPGGYSGEYVKWWGGQGRNTQVSRIETVNVNANSATVHARCRFQGKSYTARYHLIFDNSSQSWKINKIDKI